MSEDTVAQLGEWIDRAGEAIDRLQDHVDAGEIEPTIETLQDLVEVADEADELFDEIDITDLPAAIDADELIDAIDAGEIPEAIEEGDPSEMIDLRVLMKAIKLRNLWQSTDVSALLDEKEEFEDAVGDLTDESDDEDMLDMEMSDVDLGDESDEDDDLLDLPSEDYQEMIQTKAFEAMQEFRDGVTEAHQKLKQFREENRERMRRQHGETDTESRNPTAYSTLPTERPDIEGNAARHSTVSRTVRHSTAPSFDRIYGDRYDQE